MKDKSPIKDFSALSLEARNVTADRPPAIGDSRLRLTPVSVRDFNVQPNGLENQDSLETDKVATTRHCPQDLS